MEGSQKQRVLIKGKKIIGIEQVQSVVVHDCDTYQEHIEEAYHQCKLQNKPVLSTVCKELYMIALKEETSKREAARVLGVAYGTFWNMGNRIKDNDPYFLKRLPTEENATINNKLIEEEI